MNRFKALKQIRQNQRTNLGSLFIVFVFIAGCTIGGMSSVNRTMESSNDTYDKAYTNAVRAMNEVGKVTNADKETGYVNGSSTSGVDLVVTLERMPSGGTKVNTKATMPAGKIAYGTGRVDAAADRFMEAYKKYSQQ